MVATESLASRVGQPHRESYKMALLDWLACVIAGRDHPAAVAVSKLGSGRGAVDCAMVLGTAGHVLDFDDTYQPGMAHLSAAVGPAAVSLGAELDVSIGAMIDAYCDGFERMAAIARASHPHLYDRGWHPTAVCGVFGAAAAAAALLGLDYERKGASFGVAALSASGIRSVFGSHGKSLQVGMAAGAGVRAALLAESGARVPSTVIESKSGLGEAYGLVWSSSETSDEPAILENWIKAYPCCLETHSAIEAAEAARRAGVSLEIRWRVRVHPVARQAAFLDEVESGLQAKFSIPYLTAFTLLKGPPELSDFEAVDLRTIQLAKRVSVETDIHLMESEAILSSSEGEFKVKAARGSPSNPLGREEMHSKVTGLVGDRLDEVLDNEEIPIRAMLEKTGLHK